MDLRTIGIFGAAFLLVPWILAAQEVDLSVNAIDPTFNSRVQDPARPESALLPGGSSAWTGQPIMSQKPSSGTSGPAQKLGSMSTANQFPSLVGISVWGPSPSLTLSSPDAIAAQNSLKASGAQKQIQSASQWRKVLGSGTLNVTMAATKVQPASSGRAQDELPAEQSEPSDSNLKLRKLKRATARPTRARIANPFQSKADASTTAHWGADSSSARALAQQQHEGGMLLHYGFNARSTRRRKRAHASSSSNATSR